MICDDVANADQEIKQLRVSLGLCSRTTSTPKMFVRDALVSHSSVEMLSGKTTGMMELATMLCQSTPTDDR